MRPQMMRPSELLRMLYAFERDDTWKMFPVDLEGYTTPEGKRMFRGIVTANVNAIIAVACYQERLVYNLRSSGGREDYYRDGDYVPHDSIPANWAVLGGL